VRLPLGLPRVFLASMSLLLPIVLVFVLWLGSAMAQVGNHGVGHAQRHDWYEKLKQPHAPGHSCCTKADGKEGDCRPVRAYFDGNSEPGYPHGTCNMTRTTIGGCGTKLRASLTGSLALFRGWLRSSGAIKFSQGSSR